MRFIIDEGEIQRVSRVDFVFEDTQALLANALRRVIRLEPGSPYTETAAQADRDRLIRYYFQSGFPYAEVSVPETRDEDGGVVVTHSIDEGRPVTFGVVALRGNFKTREWVIREELDLAPGSPFTLPRAEAAQRNLRTSNLFKSARFDYVGLSDKNLDVINVLLQVEERYDYLRRAVRRRRLCHRPRPIRRGRLHVSTIAGIGLRLDLHGEYGKKVIGVDGKLLSPRWIQRHLLGLGFRTELSGFRRQEVTERFGELTSSGGSIAFDQGGRRGFFEGWLLSLRYDFRQRNRDEDLIRLAGDSDDIDQVPVTTRSSAIGPQLVID